MLSTSDSAGIIIAECKWRNEVTDASVLEQLIRKSALFDRYDNTYYYLFSKVGFSASCTKLADELGNVHLITLDELFFICAKAVMAGGFTN